MPEEHNQHLFLTIAIPSDDPNERNAFMPKGTVIKIEKALTNDHLRVQKYSENFAFQLLLIFQ